MLINFCAISTEGSVRNPNPSFDCPQLPNVSLFLGRCILGELLQSAYYYLSALTASLPEIKLLLPGGKRASVKGLISKQSIKLIPLTALRNIGNSDFEVSWSERRRQLHYYYDR